MKIQSCDAILWYSIPSGSICYNDIWYEVHNNSAIFGVMKVKYKSTLYIRVQSYEKYVYQLQSK